MAVRLNLQGIMLPLCFQLLSIKHGSLNLLGGLHLLSVSQHLLPSLQWRPAHSFNPEKRKGQWTAVVDSILKLGSDRH